MLEIDSKKDEKLLHFCSDLYIMWMFASEGRVNHAKSSFEGK